MTSYNLDEFIGVFDGYFGDSLCDRYVEYFNNLESNGLIIPRGGLSRHEISDKAVTLLKTDFEKDSVPEFMFNLETDFKDGSIPAHYILREFSEVFWDQCCRLYSKEYSLLETIAHHTIVDAKIQKSSAGDGYHMWHCEDEGVPMHRNRLLVFSLCLNDGYDGGETEFLYQKKRIKPQKDRLLIWPAQFTHAHRGNTVLEGVKYILTGWVEFSNKWINA